MDTTYLSEWVGMVLICLEHLLLKELAAGQVESLCWAVIVAAVHHLAALTVGPQPLNVQDRVLTVLWEKSEHPLIAKQMISQEIFFLFKVMTYECFSENCSLK